MIINTQKKITLKRSLVSLVAYENCELEPYNLKSVLEIPENTPVTFTYEHKKIFPQGLVFSNDGTISGKPKTEAVSIDPHEIKVIVKALDDDLEEIIPCAFDIKITVKSYLTLGASSPVAPEFQAHWNDFSKGFDLPKLDEVLNRKVSKEDVYYLLGKFAILIIWNADNTAKEKNGSAVSIPGVSQHYTVTDFGVALVASPKELYATDRTLKDGIQTCKALMKEVQKRKWNVEMAGYDKLLFAAWNEAEQLNKFSQTFKIRIDYYTPPADKLNKLLKIKSS